MQASLGVSSSRIVILVSPVKSSTFSVFSFISLSFSAKFEGESFDEAGRLEVARETSQGKDTWVNNGQRVWIERVWQSKWERNRDFDWSPLLCVTFSVCDSFSLSLWLKKTPLLRRQVMKAVSPCWDFRWFLWEDSQSLFCWTFSRKKKVSFLCDKKSKDSKKGVEEIDAPRRVSRRTRYWCNTGDDSFSFFLCWLFCSLLDDSAILVFLNVLFSSKTLQCWPNGNILQSRHSLQL